MTTMHDEEISISQTNNNLIIIIKNINKTKNKNRTIIEQTEMALFALYALYFAIFIKLVNSNCVYYSLMLIINFAT
jgi:hypothetical protein